MGAPKTPSKAEVDACTHITLRQHSRAEYDKFTPAEKAKHYQLKKDSGWYDKDKKRTVAEVSTGDDGGETATGTNSTNPALFHQGKIPKSEKWDNLRLSVVKTVIEDQTRTVTDVSSNLENQLHETTLELDSHADT